MALRPADFKSAASADFAIRAFSYFKLTAFGTHSSFTQIEIAAPLRGRGDSGSLQTNADRDR
jgi:hypothetical protein